jgi:signal transduction histidine kinase
VVDIKNYKETVIRDGHASLSEVVMNLGQAMEQERNKSQLSILQKEKALEIEKQENQRNVFAMVVAFFMVSIAGLAFTIYHKQRDNRLLQRHRLEIERKNQALLKTNDRLRMLNEELLQQQEEISSQRDAISQQKEKLQEVNTIIAKQKDEILNQKETLEEEVEKRTAELVKYNRQLEQYAFITAHNLRAPVARIMGLGQIIKLQKSNPEEILDILEKLIGATHELDKVIKDLNRILDLRTVSVEFFMEVDLQEELNLIQENLKMEIEQTGALIVSDLSDISKIFTIKPYIHSILFNLISNAIKYRNPDRQPVIAVKSEQIGQMICVSVTDNGMGIDLEAHKDMLFQLYKRFHFHVEGRGLGLFLVKTQIDSLGGSIKIESEVNKGTTFKVMLNKQALKSTR